MYRAIIQQRETLSSNLTSTKDIIEHEAAKVASTSADSAPLASQIADSDSDLTAVSDVSAKRRRPGRPRRNRLPSSRRMQRTC